MGKGKSKTKNQKPLPRPPQSKKLPTLWQEIPRWLWWIVLVLTAFVTLVEGVPWLSVDEGGALDPRNPYSTLFSITNGGYVLVSDLDAECDTSFYMKATNSRFNHVQGGFPRFADYLWHSGRVTIPCFRTIGLGPGAPAITDAELVVEITYSIYPLTGRLWRRNQRFAFKAVADAGGTLHWIYRG